MNSLEIEAFKAQKARIEELEAEKRGVPDHGILDGVQLPAWMWCREWERKAYVIGIFVCGTQYCEMSNGTLSGLPSNSLEALKEGAES